MPVLPVSKDIDKNIGMECLTIIDRQPHYMHQCFRIVTIHMEDRCFGYFSDICAVCTGATVEVTSSKTHLVVDYNMDGSPGFVSIKFRHLDNLVNDSLSGDSSISVDCDWNEFAIVRTVLLIDHRPGDPMN